MKIAILSNVTTSILEGMLKSTHIVWSPPGFGGWMETALNPPEELRAFKPEVFYILLDRYFEDARVWTEDELAAAKASLASFFPSVPVVVPDVKALAADFGEGFYDGKMWKLGRMPFSMMALREIKKVFGIKKVLALDLDNTIWEGVIGEDGVDGVVPNIEFQREIKTCKNQGVVLAIVSKNNSEDVEPIWNDPRMLLKKEDFVAFGINWESKSANVEKIASDLNLGKDSFVFVDDNPVERAQMRMECPDVCVAEFPPKLEVYFPQYGFTSEDANKTEQYLAEAARKKFAGGLTAEEYLNGLQIWTDVHSIRDEEISRVAQLSQKTNQFNVCTNRYSVEEIERFAHASNYLLLTLHSGDKFGDQGLVAFVLVEFCQDQSPPPCLKTARIVDWVMSCRVMNRRVEFTVQKEAEHQLQMRGVSVLQATWSYTPKNVPVRNLFDTFGFECVNESENKKEYIKKLREEDNQ